MPDAPTDKELSTLAQLGEDFYAAEAEVLRLEAELARAKRKRDTIQLEEIPEAMELIGVVSFQTPTSKFELEEKIFVQPKKDDRPLVLQAVEKQGDGALIKTTVSVPFNKGEDEKVEALLKHLKEQGLQSKQEKKIEAATLRKWVIDRLKKGKPVDLGLFGVRKFTQAIFSDGAPEEPVFEDE